MKHQRSRITALRQRIKRMVAEGRNYHEIAEIEGFANHTGPAYHGRAMGLVVPRGAKAWRSRRATCE